MTDLRGSEALVQLLDALGEAAEYQVEIIAGKSSGGMVVLWPLVDGRADSWQRCRFGGEGWLEGVIETLKQYFSVEWSPFQTDTYLMRHWDELVRPVIASQAIARLFIQGKRVRGFQLGISPG